MDTLETYPRDELFHTTVDELAPMAEQAMHARERRQLRLFIRRDTYGRYVSVLVYLPRDRYNTTVRERFSEILARPARRRLRRVHRAADRVDDRAGALRGAPAQGRGHPRGRHRRPRAPDGRGLPLLARRLRRRGDLASTARRPARVLARRYHDVVPGGLQGGLRAPDRARSTSAGSRRSRSARTAPASTCRSTRTSTPVAARPGSRSSGSARRSRCPRCCRCSRRWASRSSTSGPTSSTAWTGRRTSTTSGCATAPALPDDARELFQDAIRAVWEGFNEIDGFNALVLARRADLAAGDAAARLREVHAAGRLAVRPRLHRGGAAQQRRHHPAAGAALRGPLRPGASTATPADARDGDRGADRPGARRRREPRPRPDPALLPDPHPRDAAHQLLPARRRRRRPRPYISLKLEPDAIPDLPAAAAEVRDLRVLAAGRGRRTCASARSRAAGCAGRTGATTSAPRCSAWSRRRW